jgi:hypothetical protein
MAVIEDVQFKICNTCGENKPISEFYIKKDIHGNFKYHRSKCKVCSNSRRRELSKNEQSVFLIEKKCKICNITKDITNFNLDQSSKDKHKNICRDCFNKKMYRNDEYRKQNQIWRDEHREDIRCRQREKYRKIKKDPILKLRRMINSAVAYYTNRLKKDLPMPKFTIHYLPYTLDQLKDHLESQFEPWMTWENHGVYNPSRRTWQIDHIIPQSLLPFDSFDHPNFLKCWALENLRPLEALENIKKGNKLIPIPNA